MSIQTKLFSPKYEFRWSSPKIIEKFNLLILATTHIQVEQMFRELSISVERNRVSS
jgi:hypothetical protein